MATRFSILPWKIPWTEEPGRLLSMGLQRVRHELVTEHICRRGRIEKLMQYVIFYWRIIDLQCCVSLCHTMK